MIRKCPNHKLRRNRWHREEEPHNNHETPGRQTKQMNQPSLSHQDYRKLEWTQSNAQQNIEESRKPAMGVTINNESQPKPMRVV